MTDHWTPFATPAMLLATVAPLLRPLPEAGTPVQYHGSVDWMHGVYLVHGPCVCDNCGGTPTHLLLRPARDDGTPAPGLVLEHVRPQSITPLPSPC